MMIHDFKSTNKPIFIMKLMKFYPFHMEQLSLPLSQDNIQIENNFTNFSK